MAETIDPIPHNAHPKERKPGAMSELQDYQSNKSAQQSDVEGSSDPKEREG